MGPAACLADVESHLSDCDFEEASYSLARLGKNADKFRQSNQSATDTIQRLRDSMATALDAS